jgi:acyl-coenzyme A synthetase/AMP-(fatty) acid ligase
MQRQYPFDSRGTALFKASPGFDISIWEIFWPLYYGARLVICRPGAERDPRHLARLTEAHGVSLVFLVPTMMTAFLEEISPARADALEWVVCGGEPMSPRIPETFYATLPGSTLINAFGPTEAGPVTDNVVDRDWQGVFVPVGRPADNFRVTLLDAHLDLVPIGAPGEAYISGSVGLADGYWRAPARTAERFVADPWGPPGSRMYRTGDLCRYREDGALEHLGRIDRQIKIRGLRVEPGEIESVVAGHPAVGDCAVIAHGQPPRLLAFVVPAGDLSITDLNLASILEHAATRLPGHMRPERVVPVEHLPATVNGKIDQAELVNIWQALTDRERRVVPPADEVEATLVEIYRRVLDTSTISVLDTFSQLGGHSMLAFRLLDECKANLHAAPDMTRLLSGSLRDVAASIRGTSPAEDMS